MRNDWTTRAVAALAGLGLLGGCAANTEPESPGSCSLNCSQVRAPAGEYLVTPYFADPSGEEFDDIEYDYTCPPPPQGQFSADLPAPFRVAFRIYEKVAGFAGRDNDGSPPNPGGEGDGRTKPLLNYVPRAGIGFEPYVVGGVSTAQTNEEHRNPDGTVTPAKFTGVVTPRAEWCSDSCGVMTYEVWGVCVAGKENPIKAAVMSGAARVKGSFSFIVKNEDD